MQYRFERLEIWKQARKFCSSVYEITKEFPKEERYCLVDQLRRAALSVVLNIAEGSDRKSDLEFIRFLRISQASVCETVTGMYIALDQLYVNQKQFDKIYEESIGLSSRITATIKSIQHTSKK